jgi:uncharacterized cupredoxin-like copper-binding protein
LGAIVKPIRIFLVLLGVVLPFGVVACGDDNGTETVTETVTETAPATGETPTDTADKGEVVNVELGEAGSTFFVKPAQASVDAGLVTFAVTNVGKLYHEFIVYSNVDDIAPGDLPVNEENEADLVEEDIVGEAPYATPPIVPSDKTPGDADHRIRPEGWGAELTVDLEAGAYILLCNLTGHYQNKQYSEFTAK